MKQEDIPDVEVRARVGEVSRLGGGGVSGTISTVIKMESIRPKKQPFLKWHGEDLQDSLSKTIKWNVISRVRSITPMVDFLTTLVKMSLLTHYSLL